MDLLDIVIAKQLAGGGGGSGTDNYNDLSNLPKINDVTLSGNKSSSALGLQSEITSENKLDSDLIDDTDQDNKFVTSSEKNTWNAKQNAIDADHKLNADYVDDSTSTNKFVTASDKEAWNAKQNAIDNSHKLSSDLVDDANRTNKFVTSTEKNTWNGKQNAIDSEHKLSSSLVSFTTAEAAALASGIDSAKVAQISTNQTNILYSLQNGVKNLFDVKNANIADTFHSAVTKTDTSITISAAAGNAWARVAIPITLEAGTYHVLVSISGRTVDTGADTRVMVSTDDKGASPIGSVAFTDNGNIDFQFTSTGGTIYLTLFANYTNTAYNATFTASDIMICTQNAWNQSHDYQPYAKSNADLTQLEQQDRSALVEVVDSGAKNLFNYAAWKGCTISNGTGIFENNGITLTASSNTVCHTNFLDGVYPEKAKISVKSGDKVTLSWDYEYQSETGGSVHIYANGAVNAYEKYEPITAKRIDYIVPSGVTFLTFCVLMGENNQGKTVKFKNLMFCDTDIYIISTSYISYRKGLDELEATKAPALVLGSGVSSGSLDDVTKPTFDLYLDTVSNLPTIAAYYVETSVWDSQSMIQRAYNVGNAESYIRVKSMNTWSAWKQITNA